MIEALSHYMKPKILKEAYLNQSNDYVDKINHTNNEINYLSIKSNGLTHDEFIKDETLKRAFVRSLEIIGETVKTIPNKVCEHYRQIERNKIARMRDKLIYHYFGVEIQI